MLTNHRIGIAGIAILRILAISSTVPSLCQAFSASSTSSTPMTSKEKETGWSADAVLWAEEVYRKEKKRLLQEMKESGRTDPKNRPIHIHGQRLDAVAPPTTANDDNVKTVTKIIHFQRHGQGYHNLLGDVLRDCGVQPDIASDDPVVNPWIRPEISDSPLTALGIDQCKARRDQASTLKPQVVIVSPMLRAIQTAKLSFADHVANIPWVTHEGCREELGHLVCNQRRLKSQIVEEYPEIDFSHLITEEDALWKPECREGSVPMMDRIYEFLTDFIVTRPEDEMAVVGHSAWLFHMCSGVVDCTGADGEDDMELVKWFLTSEIRSIKLTFNIPQSQQQS